MDASPCDRARRTALRRLPRAVAWLEAARSPRPRGGAPPPLFSGSLAVKAERASWILCALALGAATFGWADGALYQRRHLGSDFAAVVEAGARSPDAAAFSPGTPIARLAIPRLELEAVVAEGTAPTILRRAIGRLASSDVPGGPGNIALAAHRDTFFRPLEGIERGDLVVLESAAGRDSYVVEWISVVEPEEVAVAGSTSYPALTLITCYPFRYVGTAPRRFVVRARRLEDPSASRAAAAPPVGTLGPLPR
jgi:sortase A